MHEHQLLPSLGVYFWRNSEYKNQKVNASLCRFVSCFTKFASKLQPFRQIATTRHMAFFTSFSHQNVMLFLATVIIVIHEFFTDSELFEWKPNNLLSTYANDEF